MITVRHMESEEVESIRELDVSESDTIVYKWIGGQIVAVSEQWQRPRWDASECDKRISKIRERLAKGEALIGAFDKDLLVGAAIFRPHLDPGRSELAGLWISRKYRRQGIATQLTREVERLAQKAGITALYVSACPSRSAVGFYRSRGFRPTQNVNKELYEQEPEDIHMIMKLGTSREWDEDTARTSKQQS